MPIRRWVAIRRLRRRALASLPFGERAILVVQAEEPAWEPPPDGSPNRGSLTPAVRIALTFPITGIVDSLKEASRHIMSVGLIQLRTTELDELLVLRRGWSPAKYGPHVAEAMNDALP